MKQTHHRSRLLLIGLIGLTALIACQKPEEVVLDSTPDAFSFASKTAVAITGTDDIESEPVTIAGINTAATVSVTAGKYGIDGAACTATAGTINVGQKLRLCVPRPKTAGSESTATVTVGGVTVSFKASAEPLALVLALTPANFNAQFDVSKNATLTSNELTVSGLAANATTPVSISPAVAGAKLLINNVEKASPSSVKNDDKIKVSITSASTDSAVSNVSLKVGEVGKELNATFSVRTAGPLAANEFAPLETLVDYRPATGENAPTNSFVVPDTTPTCKYGTGPNPGPWRKATAAEIAVGDIDLFYRTGYEFKKSGTPKSGWNNCPENWDEAAILAAGDAGQNLNGEVRKFGKTTLNFNVAGTGNVTKVELKLKLAHQSRADLLMTLVSPTGTRIVIFDLEKDSLGSQIRNTQFSNPNSYNKWKNGVSNGWPDGANLFESTGVSIIFDDAAVPPVVDNPAWTPVGDEAATLRFRCGQNDRTAARVTGNSLGACWNNGNTDGKANFPGITGFGSFARVRPSNPLAGFVGQALTGTWKLEIEDRATGNQESNDDAFPPFRPLAGQTGFTNSAGVLIPGVTGVDFDTKDLVRQPALSQNNIPRVRVATLTVK
jgi:subtilisin-like proprotein convertase family protein